MIEPLNDNNREACIAMALLLWPDTDRRELEEDFLGLKQKDNWGCFLYQTDDGEFAGFILLSIRTDYVEGCESASVGYIEGIIVKESFRRNSIARALVRAGECWAKEKGCTQIGSDCELDNHTSYTFHTGIGFTEASRIICFIKDID